MSRIHSVREGRYSKYTNESKFGGTRNTDTFAEEAISDGDKLRKKIAGRRILPDLRDERELKNSFRL